MILAAGLGTRLRPLTERLPKPLIQLGRYRLIEYHIQALVRAGIKRIVINVSHLGHMIKSELGDGSIYGCTIRYSEEDPAPLETGGGILRALPLISSDPFLVVNGDVWSDYDFSRPRIEPRFKAHLVLVPNPPHKVMGDFILRKSVVSPMPTTDVSADAPAAGSPHAIAPFTFSGIGLYRKSLFFDTSKKGEVFPLAPLLRDAAVRGEVSGELFTGTWIDVGSHDRLAEAKAALADREYGR